MPIFDIFGIALFIKIYKKNITLNNKLKYIIVILNNGTNFDNGILNLKI